MSLLNSGIRGRRQDAVGPVALIEQELQIVRLAVNCDAIVCKADRTEPM